MNDSETRDSRLVKPLPVWFLLGLVLVNLVAISPVDPLYIGAFFSFLYILFVPGFLLLPLFVRKRMPLFLGLAMSAAVSVLVLILVGLGINTVLPLLGNATPLSTLPLLFAFDILIYTLLICNFLAHSRAPVEIPTLNGRSWRVLWIAALLPLLACLGAIQLNNGVSNALAMSVYGIAFFITLAIITSKNDIDESLPPFILYALSLAFLLMNSMRGWLITGHDILLEYHVFTLVSNAHLWSMALYQDPYMACLSLTILPTYLQNLLPVNSFYIFKFFLQFIGAMGIVPIYYLAKEYISEKLAYLAAFLYISFPTFMTDMAFLNRQGIALLFFAALVFVLLTTEYISGWRRHFFLILLGTGMILSHYSTSYVAVAVLAGAYVITRIIRLFSRASRERKILITLPFVIILLLIIVLWVGVITKTGGNVTTTLAQIAESVKNPFGGEEHAGVDQYSLVKLAQPTPQQLFQEFVQGSTQQMESSVSSSALFPPSLTNQYPATLGSEPLIPITPLGASIQSTFHVDLVNFYDDIKQAYADIMQVFLLIGFAGLIFGYSFRKNILKKVPAEYLALSLAGIAALVAQTVLPSSVINYGLLRLFQQNLIFLGLPIVLGLVGIFSFIFRNQRVQWFFCGAVMLFFFAILSGLVPELTGNARALLPLNNYGFYYDAYYTHPQEVAAIDWIAENGDPSLPVQSDLYFSAIKILGYANIGTIPGLLPTTILRSSYVYLNYGNTKTGDVIQYIGGAAVYYHFPVDFLSNNKDLIYDNGGSMIYQ